MRKKLLLCMNELGLAEKALVRMTQLVFYKSGRKDFSNEELEEFTDHYLQLGLLEHTLHKLRMELTEWMKATNEGK
ncbi:hypothetical protein [Sporomusa acidovorans]|uniref:Uncharacterized protein n=1 Tax=Sporomusa acidovorans (strain ATCC 49682 / DSM 3132 / Mol) TaxID=1123286 RepID=A0ABZ3IZB5_SPOA4|nr:hypothetical protein [Sporomusa acidovorans]OZC17253.1 hypothetical protein SPACI_39030 [Sporomusa acidovorans DSM 3132]SDF15821.1 hypothetical protein SAMN04488499_103536 [Sporomusa acidovorans]